MPTPKTVDADLPYDQHQDPIQVLGVDESTVASVAIPVGSSSAATALPGSPGAIVELTVTEAAYIAFGGAGVSATTASRLLNPGTYVYRRLDGQTHYAVRALSTAGSSTAVAML